MLLHDVLDGTAQVNSGTAGGVEVDGHVPLDGNDAVAAGWTGSFRVLQDLGETMDQPGKCEQDAADVNGEGEHCKHTQELAVRMFL